MNTDQKFCDLLHGRLSNTLMTVVYYFSTGTERGQLYESLNKREKNIWVSKPQILNCLNFLFRQLRGLSSTHAYN